MERHVAVGQVARRLALEVADEPRARRRDTDRAGVDEELDRVGPDELPTNETDGVGAHRAGGADVEDAPCPRRDREVAAELGSRGDARQAERQHRFADGQLYPGTEHAVPRGIAHDHRSDARLTDHDVAVHHVEFDRERVATDEVGDRDEDEDDARVRDDDELDDAETVAGDEAGDRGREHRPAERRHDGGDPRPEADEYTAHDARAAHEADDDVRSRSRAVADDPRARVRQPEGARLGRVGDVPDRGDRICPCWPDRPRRVLLEGHTACLSLGGTVSMSSCPMMLDAVTPSNSASASRMSRCASTGSASTFTSSGMT